MIEAIAAPKQRQAAPQKDDAQASEDETTFAMQLAAEDAPDKSTEASETGIMSVSASELAETVTAKTEAQSENASATKGTDVSFQMFAQTASNETVETPPQDPATITAAISDAEVAAQTAPAEGDTPPPSATSSEADVAKQTPDIVAATATTSAATPKTTGDPTVDQTTDAALTSKAVNAETASKTAAAEIPAGNQPNQQAPVANSEIIQPTATTGALSEAVQSSATAATSTAGEATTVTSTLGAASQSTTAPSAPAPPQAAQPPAAPQLVAPPEDIPKLITQAMTADDSADRIVIQLDPPELGRVSVDFKIDATGVQTVTVTAETPEAIKKLRLMNFELIQAMEENGLSSGGFSLDYQQSQQSSQHNVGQTFVETGFDAQDTQSVIALTETALYRSINSGQAGLNLKL